MIKLTPMGACQGFRKAIFAALLLLAVAGCTNVLDAYRIDPISLGSEPGVVCSSGLGSYALPKAFLHVVVGIPSAGSVPDIVLQDDASTVNPNAVGRPVGVIRHPDRSLVFCLDYLSSTLSHDRVTVKKWPASVANKSFVQTQPLKTSFLGAVLINAQDRTVFIIEALLRAAFIAASGDPNFAPRDIAVGTTPSAILADLEFDPFDPRETAEVNARLSSLGICLVLEGYTLDRYRTNVDSYCNAPKRYQTQTNPILKAYAQAEAAPADPFLPGLLYRPRVPYRLSVFRKPDPGGSGRWKLSETQQVMLENLSPVLSLDVRRAAFAGRNANFIFDNGTLTVACVAKNSEIEGFVQIPLQISKSLVALPASIISVQIDSVSKQADLANAEKQLVQVQQAYFAALAKGGTFTAPSGTPTGPTATPTPTDVTALPSDLVTAKNDTAISSAPLYGADIFGVDRAAICGAS